MAEEEQRHRHLLEKSFAQNNQTLTNERRNSQYMAFAIAVLFPVLGVYLIMNGAKIEGSIFGGVGLIPVIYAFIPKKDINENGE